MSDIHLIVQADDLGMCHAVNEGIQKSFEEGIVTQTVAMAPCPWIDEGASIVKKSGIHAGMHCTLTCEWEYLRWRPFTRGSSLSEGDGTFHRTLEGAISALDAEEASAELDAQFAHLIGIGLEPAYFDCHMGPTSTAAFAHVVEAHGRPFLYPLAPSHYAFSSTKMLSPMAANEKLGWMLDYLDALEPGVHYLCTHPAVADTELRSITPSDSANAAWAEDFRVSDLEVLTSGAVRDRIEKHGISLATVEEMQPVRQTS